MPASRGMVQYHAGITLVLVGGVAAISLGLTFLALRARQRTGSSRLLYVAWAFFLFAVKSALTTFALLQDPEHPVDGGLTLGHGHLEFLGAAFDLGIVALLAAPFIRRRAVE